MNYLTVLHNCLLTVVGLVAVCRGATSESLSSVSQYEKCYASAAAARACPDLPAEPTSCLGGQVTYHRGSSLSAEFVNENAVARLSHTYLGVQLLPECWDAFREAMCQIAMPECNVARVPSTDNESSTLPLPLLASFVDCEILRKKCKFLIDMDRLYPSKKYWPSAFGDSCGGSDIFYQNRSCDSLRTRIEWDKSLTQFQSAKKCPAPLVCSAQPDGWVFGIHNCSLACKNPWMHESDMENIRLFGLIWAMVALVFSVFTCTIILLSHCCADSVSKKQRVAAADSDTAGGMPTSVKTLRNRPTSPVHPSLFFLVAVLASYGVISVVWVVGTLLDFLATLPTAISCRKDGSLRLSEPSNGFTICVFEFVCIYVGCIWVSLCLLLFAWSQFVCLTRLKIQARIVISSWRSSMLVITLGQAGAMAVWAVMESQVDADGVTGICFLGFHKPYILLLAVHLPICIALLASLILVLIGVGRRSILNKRDLNLWKAREAGESTMRRCCPLRAKLVLLYVVLLLLVLMSGGAILYDWYDERAARWRSLRETILCQLFPTSKTAACRERLKRSGTVYYDIHIVALFLPPILISVWLWFDDIWKGVVSVKKFKTSRRGDQNRGDALHGQGNAAELRLLLDHKDGITVDNQAEDDADVVETSFISDARSRKVRPLAAPMDAKIGRIRSRHHSIGDLHTGLGQTPVSLTPTGTRSPRSGGSLRDVRLLGSHRQPESKAPAGLDETLLMYQTAYSQLYYQYLWQMQMQYQMMQMQNAQAATAPSPEQAAYFAWMLQNQAMAMGATDARGGPNPPQHGMGPPFHNVDPLNVAIPIPSSPESHLDRMSPAVQGMKPSQTPSSVLSGRFQSEYIEDESGCNSPVQGTPSHSVKSRPKNGKMHLKTKRKSGTSRYQGTSSSDENWDSDVSLDSSDCCEEERLFVEQQLANCGSL